MLVPSTWKAMPGSQFDHAVDSPEQDAYVSSSRLASVGHVDVATIAEERAANLAQYEVAISSTRQIEIEGHEAVVSEETLPKGDTVAYDIAVTEYLVDLDDGTYALVIVGERQPEDRAEVREWIGSTLTIRDAPAYTTPVVHPDRGLASPDGVTSQMFGPEHLHVALDVPSTWKAFDPIPRISYEYGIGSSPTSPPAVLAKRVVSVDGSPDERKADLLRFGATIDDESATVIDGHEATILRYRIPIAPDGHIASVDLEYLIDIGGGDVAIVSFRVGVNPDTADLIRWMRSTIRVI
jgi:hypothetical protein